jgi:hypothetical protein
MARHLGSATSRRVDMCFVNTWKEASFCCIFFYQGCRGPQGFACFACDDRQGRVFSCFACRCVSSLLGKTELPCCGTDVGMRVPYRSISTVFPYNRDARDVDLFAFAKHTAVKAQSWLSCGSDLSTVPHSCTSLLHNLSTPGEEAVEGCRNHTTQAHPAKLRRRVLVGCLTWRDSR